MRLFFLALLLAAPPPGDPVDEGPGVVIEAPRPSLDLKHDQAAAGVVLLPEDLDDPGETLPAVLDQQAGVRVTRLGGPAAFSTLSIRGSTGDQVLVIIDGIPLNAAAGGAVDLSRLPLGNLERIEVYRGTVPLCLGASAIGGAVSLATRRPRGRELSVSAETGAFGARAARLFFGERQPRWDLALGLDYGGWEGGFPYLHDGGTRFDPTDDRSVQRRNNRADQLGALARGGVQIGGRWRLDAVDWFFWRDQGIPGLGQFETRRAGYFSLENLSALDLRGEDLAGMVDWRTTMSLRWARSRFSDPLSEVGLAGGGADDTTWAPGVRTHLAVTPLPWWKVDVAAGVRYERFEPLGAALSAAPSERHRVDGGLETAFHVPALDLLFIPSVRVEHADSRGPAAAAAGTEWSGRVALVNESLPDLRVSISGGRGVRLPSLFELFGNSGRVLGNTGLRPETAWSADGGIVYSSTMLPAGWKLRAEAFAFLSSVEDLIQFVQTAQNVAVAENVDRALLRGVELGLRADLLRHLRLSGNWTLLDARNTGGVAAREGKDLPGRPASKWYARAEGYFREIPHVRELSLYVDAEWIAGNFIDNANLVAVGDRFRLGLGLAARLRRPDLSLAVAAQNLTDERTMDLAGYPIPGRSWHLLLTWGIL
ncbi:MAG: TonB-dependent receptor [Pseudomonadota bacterium]